MEQRGTTVHGISPATQDTARESHPSTGESVIVAPAAARAALWGNIPQELRDRPQWVLARPDKKPLTSCYTPASVTNPSSWVPFTVARQAAVQGDFFLGFVLTATDPFACIDLDVNDDTTPERIARFIRIQQVFDSFSERSMNGKGLHIWIKASIGPGRKRDGVEVYSQDRFIICTGDVYENKPIAERQALAEQLLAEMDRRHTPTVAELIEIPPVESDEAVYWRARGRSVRTQEKFDRLWNGDWRGYPSQSEADHALLSYLVHATPSNEQVRRLFRWSGLGRTLGRKAKPDDYINRTLRQHRATQAAAKAMAAQIEAGWLR